MRGAARVDCAISVQSFIDAAGGALQRLESWNHKSIWFWFYGFAVMSLLAVPFGTLRAHRAMRRERNDRSKIVRIFFRAESRGGSEQPLP